MLHQRSVARSALAVLALTSMSTAARIDTRATPYTLLAGGYTNVITTITFDPAGKISVVGSADSGTNPSWLATHPTVKTVSYSTNEYDGGFISSFTTTDPSRIVKKVNSASALGDAPAHLAVVRGGTEVLAADYNSGTVAAYTLSGDKLNFTGGQKIGPFPSATNISHPHQVVEYGKEVFIPDLGADKIWRLAKGYSGWVTTGSIAQPAGSGPRHIATRGNVVFVLHELSNTLAAQYIPYVPSNSTTTATINTVSVLPPAIPGQVDPGRFHAAELILSLDGQYLYASNRDTSATPDPRGDAIAIVRVGSNGSLTIVKHVFTGLQLLRGFSLSPDGKYLIGGGQAAGGVAAWAIVSGGADLKEVARNSAGPAATGFTWL